MVPKSQPGIKFTLSCGTRAMAAKIIPETPPEAPMAEHKDPSSHFFNDNLVEEEQRDHVEYQVFPPSMQKARGDQSQVVSPLYSLDIEHIATKESLVGEAIVAHTYSNYKNTIEENIGNHAF